MSLTIVGIALNFASGAATALPASAGDCSQLADALGVSNTDESLRKVLRQALKDADATNTGKHGGFGLHMWGTLVNRDGYVCAVAFSGDDRAAQWAASRVISAQKASTANSLSTSAGDNPNFLDGLALSTANLYASAQPGGSLWGVQFANPVDPGPAYLPEAGEPVKWGTKTDPLLHKRIAGHNVFGGGFALYDSDHQVVGGLGVSGDTSCKDHNFGWYVRHNLGLDHVHMGPAAAFAGDVAHPDNIIYDMDIAETGKIKSPSHFGHTDCNLGEKAASQLLPAVGE